MNRSGLLVAWRDARMKVELAKCNAVPSRKGTRVRTQPTPPAPSDGA